MKNRLSELFQDDKKDCLVIAKPVELRLEINRPKIRAYVDKSIHYVYVYLDPRKPGKYVYEKDGFKVEFEHEPFYVGKGSYRRYLTHINERNLLKDTNKLKTNKIKKIIKETGKDPIIVKYKENLSEKEAFQLEMLLIKIIGRIDLKTGFLTNMTDGGEGNSGIIFSKEHREKISKNNLGKKMTDETKRRMSESRIGEKNPMYGIPSPHKGKKNSKYQNEKISIALKGKPKSEETRKKISESEKGKIIPEEIRKKTSESLKLFYKNNPDKILRGENHPLFNREVSEETKKKLSESLKGKNKDKKRSDETKRKISEYNKNCYWIYNKLTGKTKFINKNESIPKGFNIGRGKYDWCNNKYKYYAINVQTKEKINILHINEFCKEKQYSTSIIYRRFNKNKEYMGYYWFKECIKIK